MSVAESNADIRILYVEDDPPSGRLVQSIAETAGYAVDVVTNGNDFLSALASTKPDLLLLDLHLPDASGHDLLAKARLEPIAAPVAGKQHPSSSLRGLPARDLRSAGGRIAESGQTLCPVVVAQNTP